MQNNDDLLSTINRTALIENMLNQVIHAYCAPRKEVYPFFWNVLLDSSILSLGSKVKLVTAISQELNTRLNSNALHRILALRNAFAHHATDSHLELSVGTAPEADEQHYMLQIITSSGKVTRQRRDVHLPTSIPHMKPPRDPLQPC